jgi:hypothetical protein
MSESKYLGEVVSVTDNDASHKVVMPAEIFGGGVVYDVDAMVEWPLQIWAHHGVVDDDDSVRGAFLGALANGGKIDDLEERIGGIFEKDHGGLSRSDMREDDIWICGVDMINDDSGMIVQVFEETVGSAVKIVTDNDFVAGPETTEDDVGGGHARGDGEGMLRIRYLGDVMLCETG